MRFDEVGLDDDVVCFWDEVAALLDEHLTEDVRRQLHASGATIHRPLHEAMGARGWIVPEWPEELGGAGLDPLRLHVLQHELLRRQTPSITTDTTAIGARVVARWGSAELKDAVLLDVARGRSCICLGYTEPDAGSDLAAVRTRAVRSGTEWVVNGSKMFTTGAEACDYIFLLARTDPDAPKHRGLSTFLVPLRQPGIEIAAIETMGGERTNVVYFSDAVVPDSHRLGEVGRGWKVVAEPLDDEHGIGTTDASGLGEINGQGAWHLRSLRLAFDLALAWALENHGGGRRFDDPDVRRCLAGVALDLEVCRDTPEAMGRVVAADALIAGTEALLRVMGPAATLLAGEEGSVAGGVLEWAHRFAQASAIYGGTTDIHRNIIAERILGLPRRAAPQPAK